MLLMDDSFRLIIIFLTIVCNLFFSWLILARSVSSRKVAKLIAMLCLFISLWTISNYFYDQDIPYVYSLLANRLVFTFTAPLIAVLVHLAIIFPNDIKISRKLVSLIYLLVIIFVPLSLTDFIVKDTQMSGSVIRPVFNYGAVLFGISAIVMSIIAVIKFKNNYEKSEGFQKQQMQYFIFGISITCVIALFTNLIFPMFLNVFVFTDFGPASSLVFICLTALAIIKYRLFDVKFIFGKIVYFLSISVLPYLMIYIFYFLINTQPTKDGYIFYMLGVPFAIIFIFLNSRFNRFITSFTDSRFIYPDYNPLEIIEQYKRDLSDLLTENEIVDKTLSILARTIRPEQLGLVLLQEESASVKEYHYKERSKTFGDDTILTIISFLNDNFNKPLIIDEFKGYLQQDKHPPIEYRNLLTTIKEKSIKILYPLLQKNKCIGFMYLGMKESDYPYTPQEINYISIFIDSLTLSLHKSNVLEETRKFNIELKSKIKQATKILREKNLELEENKTALQHAYRQLKTLDDAKSDFISIASHQLRTPLSIIKGYLSMLTESDYGKVNDEQKRIINMSINALNDLNGIVNEILMSSRIEKGTFAITKAPADMIEIIKYIRDLYENKYKEKGLDFKVILPKGVSKLVVNIDRDKFEQVIINLIENAYNYTLKGSVVITLEEKPKTFKLSFKDTGIGIAKDDYGKLFEKFVRLDNAQKIRPDGTGIGLYTAKVIVETHKGKIWFESEEGKGTTFFVEMPKQ